MTDEIIHELVERIHLELEEFPLVLTRMENAPIYIEFVVLDISGDLHRFGFAPE